MMRNIINLNAISDDSIVGTFKNADISSLGFFHEHINQNYSSAQQLNEAGNALSKASFTLHTDVGVLYSIQKEVRQSIMGIDVTDARFDETQWMSKSILFNFEKSGDSQVMLQKVTKETYMKLAQRCTLTSKDTNSLICLHKFFQENPKARDHDNLIVWKIFKGKFNGQQKTLKESKFGWFSGNASFSDIRRDYLGSNEDNYETHFTWVDGDSEDDYTERLHSVGCLEMAFKVLAFSSVPMLRPQPISKNKKLLNKLKKQGNPIPSSGGIFRVVNLPHEIYCQQKKQFTSQGEAKNLDNGRAGGLVYYKHERYTNKRFTWGFRVPIPDKHGKLPKVAYRIKRPTNGSIPVQLDG